MLQSMTTLMPKFSSPPSFLRRSKSWNTARRYTSSDIKGRADPNHPRSSRTYDLTLLHSRIREWSEQAGLTFRGHADVFTLTTKTTLSQLGSQLNRVTGYEEIEKLKRQVVEQEVRINATRQAAREAKRAYDRVVGQRSSSQREVNDLLQRKSTWSDDDVSRFTILIRQDHLYEQDEARAKADVIETENAVEREFTELMRSILGRYHEEQVWSDKIRSASTYGSLAVLGLNLLIFVVAIVVVEPWKRRRLAQTFEKKIEQMSLENAALVDGGMKDIGKKLEEQSRLWLEVQTTTPTPKEPADNNMNSPSIPHQDWRLGAAVGTSAVVAGLMGWLACNWFGH